MACCSTHAELLPLSKHNTGHLWSPGAFSQISLCSLRMMWRHLQDESRCFTVLHPAYVCLASAEESFKVKINRERFAAAGPTTGDVRTSKVNTQKIPNSNKRSPSGKLRNFLHPPRLLKPITHMCHSHGEEEESFLLEFWKQPPVFALILLTTQEQTVFLPLLP